MLASFYNHFGITFRYFFGIDFLMPFLASFFEFGCHFRRDWGPIGDCFDTIFDPKCAKVVWPDRAGSVFGVESCTRGPGGGKWSPGEWKVEPRWMESCISKSVLAPFCNFSHAFFYDPLFMFLCSCLLVSCILVVLCSFFLFPILCAFLFSCLLAFFLCFFDIYLILVFFLL